MITLLVIASFIGGFAIGTGIATLFAALILARRDQADEFAGDAFPVDGGAGR
mgnify:CR=1 FL=1